MAYAGMIPPHDPLQRRRSGVTRRFSSLAKGLLFDYRDSRFLGGLEERAQVVIFMQYC